MCVAGVARTRALSSRAMPIAHVVGAGGPQCHVGLCTLPVGVGVVGEMMVVGGGGRQNFTGIFVRGFFLGFCTVAALPKPALEPRLRRER